MANISGQDAVIVRLSTILLETIIEAGPEGAPSGLCYTAFMSFGVSYSAYMHLVQILKVGELITEEHHVLHATEKALRAYGDPDAVTIG